MKFVPIKTFSAALFVTVGLITFSGVLCAPKVSFVVFWITALVHELFRSAPLIVQVAPHLLASLLICSRVVFKANCRVLIV